MSPKAIYHRSVRVTPNPYLELAAAQCGAIHRRQLAEHGVSAKVIRRLVDGGHLIDQGHDTFVIGGTPSTWLRSVWISWLSAPLGSVVSHRTAAVINQIGRLAPGPVDITLPQPDHATVSPGAPHASNLLPPGHIVVVDGLPVTSPARTVFDLARLASRQRWRRGWPSLHRIRVERAMDDALANGTTYAELLAVLHDLEGRGRGGTVLFRELLDDRGPGFALTESELEDLVVRVLRSHGVDPPERQVDVGGTRAPIGRVDFLDRPARLVLEADGRKHHSELLDRERDAWRDIELAAAGYQVLRVTHRQLSREPGRFANRYRDVVTRRRQALQASNFPTEADQTGPLAG